jgi:hypothetical protein
MDSLMTTVWTTRKISETKSDEVCAKAGIWRMNKAATVYVGLWRTGAKQKLLRFGGNLGRQPGQPRRQVGIISMAFWLAIFRGEKMKYGCIDRTLELLSIMRNKSIRGSGECSKSRKRCSQFHVVGKLPTPRPFTTESRKQVSIPRPQPHFGFSQDTQAHQAICFATAATLEG